MLVTGLTLDEKRVVFAAEDVKHVFFIENRKVWSVFPDGSAYACFFVYPESVGSPEIEN